MDLLLSGLWFLVFMGCIVTGFVAAVQLDRHDKFGAGFAWGFFFGPVGLLVAVIIAANLDREKSDRQTRDLLQAGHLTREQETKRAVLAALAAHLANEQAGAMPNEPSASPSPLSPSARSYEEIMASEPQRPPRRFR